MRFEECLRLGLSQEEKISEYLASEGYCVLRVKKGDDDDFGPRLITLNRKLVVPDILAWKKKLCCWVEVKFKTGFTWHMKTKRWTTGIDLRLYKDYIKVQEETGLPLWLLFWHEGGRVKDSGVSPRGLYGATIKYLKTVESHRWDRGGMVYWAKESLIENPELIKIPKALTQGTLF